MEEIKVSVIIPVYNTGKYLKQCLDSVAGQTLKDIEIICIDDGSSDNSLNILNTYKKIDARFQIVKQNHKGACAARNLGLKLAKGKYVQFLDSDDIFDTLLLEKMYERAEKYDTDVTICSSNKIDENGVITETKSPNFPVCVDKIQMEKVFNKFDYKEDIFCLLIPVIWNKLIKKTFLEENGLEFPKLPIYEDIAFAHSIIALADRIVAFNEELISYRFNRKGSLVSTRSFHTIDAVKSCLYLEQLLKQKGLYDEFEEAYKKVVISHIQAETSYCNDEEYKNFLLEFKKMLPNDWQKYRQALRKDYITPEYLNKFIGNKRVMLWGASLFIKQVLSKEQKANPNILGVIDRSESITGTKCGNYTIYSPDAIYELKPDGIILTVLSNNELIYQSLEKEFIEKYPNVKLLPNIFKAEIQL